MAVISIPNSAYQQVDERYALDANGVKTRRVQFKGTDYAALKTAADGISLYDAYGSGYLITGWELASVPGGGGSLTLSLAPSSGSDSSSQTALRAAWTCKSVRNDVSVLAYCGGAARRVALELWMKEADADVADANEFHRTETETDQLNSQEQEIADKIRKGVDSVVRFYPVLTCTSTWSRIPSTFMEKLGYVDTPGAPSADETVAPSNLSSVISSHDWLKCQDDVAETGDGRWTRTESWMGIPKADGGGWDADLYGSSRWAMPLGGGS